ncbi:prephenate dehydrogenase [Formosa algae]|uniref:Prephenate dehydrogenase n=1 Tax=Formosa algae TaxID=225843 RepID=A0A9X0YHE5_9FLAO|nr:prephenate dehydrogenase [Formosa algae]MBP1838240.1 prephenate dehydrogenase [Formosa algae]MDQ0334375.1 prephenate dehydrogenase [Formosa algae]OEI80681.1 prephenate dehydrogenase [Formosa algae]
MNNIVVIGIGLIGGSMVKDLKKAHPDTKIIGVDKNVDHLNQALVSGLIDEKSDLNAVKTADLVILSIPVDASVSLLPEILDLVSEDTLVIDVGSTKLDACQKVEHHVNRRNYLACHPIAGTEFSGPQAAIYDLFKNKTNIICEVEKTAFKLQERALQVFSDLGMRIRYMNPESHDKHIAYVSHLSHISSFMLGKTVIDKERNERDIFDMAGSGFASTVRLAKSSPNMWTPIFKQNKTNVIETLDEYINNLNQFKILLERDDFEAIFDEMKNTNRIKDILKGIA